MDPSVYIGVVVIGRNEGSRLQRCLKSLEHTAARVVYVDSGSTDDSVVMVRSMGTEVVELDMSTPFCAARARNEGYEKLVKTWPQLRFIQFLDGDCELIDDWLYAAVAALEITPELAIVAGRLHERHPEVSIYNRLGNLEWNFAGVGETDSVGGIFMIRREAFDNVGGFDPTVAAGEEPELCRRLKLKGWRLRRLDHDMGWHDLAMTRFGQWWKRMIRFGYGSMDVAERFGLQRYCRNNLRARAWSGWLLVVVLLVVFRPLGAYSAATAILLFGAWPAQLSRIALRTWRQGHTLGLSAAYAFFIMLSHWPQLWGQVLWLLDRRRKQKFRLVEYKSTDRVGSPHEGRF